MPTYIHGTNSLVLALLEATDFSLISPPQALQKYGLAPFGGEVILGGYRRIDNDGIAFGALETLPGKSNNCYTLDKILEDYANERLEPFAVADNHKNLTTMLRDISKKAFSLFNILLIYLARAKQTGLDSTAIIDPAAVNKIKEEFKLTIQLFNLFLLLGTAINVKEPTFFKFEKWSQLFSNDDGEFSFAQLCKKIKENNLDLEAIVAKGDFSPHALQPVLELLDCTEGQFFTASAETKIDDEIYTKKHGKNQCTDSDFFLFSINNEFSLFFRQIIQCEVRKQYFLGLQEKIKAHLPILKEKMRQFDNLLAMQSKNFLTEEMRPFTEKPFPLVFVAENCEAITLFDADKVEYRTNSPLVFGKDIKIIATDNEQHQQLISDFFKAKNKDVRVITFAELRQWKLYKAFEQFEIYFKTHFAEKFKHTNSTGIIKIQTLLTSNLPPFAKLEQIVQCAKDKTAPGIRLRFSQSHFFFPGRHKNVHQLYEKIAQLDITNPSKAGDILKEIEQWMQQTHFLHPSMVPTAPQTTIDNSCRVM